MGKSERRKLRGVCLALILLAVADAAPCRSGATNLVFIRDGRMFLAGLEGGEPLPLLPNMRGFRSPQLSPSGRWISARYRSGIFVLHLASGNGATLGRGPYGWAPDEDRVAMCGAYGTSVFALRDRVETQLPVTSDCASIWNRAGDMLGGAAVRQRSGKAAGLREGFLFAIPFGSARRIPLRRAPSTGFLPLAWSAAGDLLFYELPDFSGSVMADGLELYAVRPADQRRRSLGLTTLVRPDMAVLDPSGTLLAAAAGFGRESYSNKTITVLELATGRRRALTPAENAASISPAWSPDGERIAYASAASAAMGDWPLPARRIFVVRKDGGARRQLTHGGGAWHDERPQWSADGKTIVFCRRGTHGKGGSIWAVPADASGQPRRIVDRVDVPEDYYGYAAWDGVMSLSPCPAS